jgi:hypothetical protein
MTRRTSGVGLLACTGERQLALVSQPSWAAFACNRGVRPFAEPDFRSCLRASASPRLGQGHSLA